MFVILCGLKYNTFTPGSVVCLHTSANFRNFAQLFSSLFPVVLKKILLYILLALAVAAPAMADTKEPQVLLSELEVRPRKEKYSKKNNPAVDFVRRIMQTRDLTDPRRHPYYSYGKYERINLGIIDFDKIDSTARFGFINEYMDTTMLTGRKVLNLSVKEKLSDHYFRAEPETDREVVRAINRHGLDELTRFDESVQTSIMEVMREVDIYDHDIPVLMNRFVSPLGRLAPDFYKFYLTDTIADENSPGDSLVVLSFVPRNVSQFGFNGKLFVAKGDTTMFIRRAVLNVPVKGNVNFISRMVIDQDFERAPDGTRLKVKDDLVAEFNILTQSLFARRLTIYNSHSFSQPADTSIFDRGEKVIYLDDMRDRSAQYWAEGRPAGAELQHGEANMAGLLDRLRKDPIYYWGERTLKLLIGGYVHVGGDKKAKVDIGPILTFVGSNGLEGFRLRAGGTTTPRLSPRWFMEGYVGYGFKDHKVKYDAAVEYSFIDKKLNQYEFPVRSLKLHHQYDVDKIGQKYFTENNDAVFYSITRIPNKRMTYLRRTDLEFKWEFYNNLAISIGASLERQEATRYMEFETGLGQRLGHFNQLAATLDLRWAPGEKIFQLQNSRKLVYHEMPIFHLRHIYSPKGVAGSHWGVNKTEFSYEHRYFFSSWGYLDLIFTAGHVWDQTVFTNLLVPNANISYIIQGRCFSLLNPMEFVNDTDVSLHLTYWLNGAILNYIPGVKRLKLREVIGFRTMWGHLSDRNNPALNPTLLRFPADVTVSTMGRKPYMEMFVGLDNIFRILRVDYVHRLNYKSNPGIDRWGIRLGIHFTF